jgi:hypothetical protein
MAQRREMMSMGATLMMLSATVIWQVRNHSALGRGELEAERYFSTRAPTTFFPPSTMSTTQPAVYLSPDSDPRTNFLATIRVQLIHMTHIHLVDR